MTQTATHARNICPGHDCGKPIPDTAYICTGCTNKLRQHLLTSAKRLTDLEHTIVYGTVTDAHRGPGAIAEPRAIHGPFHLPSVHDCRHPSCHAALDSQWQAARYAAAEQPVPHEAASPFNVGASETLWEFQNTVTTWARHVLEERDITLPEPAPPTPTPRVVTAPPPEPERPGRCRCCDLPTYSCQHRPTTEETA